VVTRTFESLMMIERVRVKNARKDDSGRSTERVMFESESERWMRLGVELEKAGVNAARMSRTGALEAQKCCRGLAHHSRPEKYVVSSSRGRQKSLTRHVMDQSDRSVLPRSRL